LYEFFDQKENEVFKYGISADPIEADGLSRRIRRQLSIFNLAAGWLRYIARILVSNISGRKAAEKIENQHMEDFQTKHGHLPRGNRKKNGPGV